MPDSRLMCASHDEPPKVGDSTNAETTSRPVSWIAAVELGAARGERRRDVRPLEGDRAVRLDEDEEDVGATDAREVGVIGGLGGSVVDPGASPRGRTAPAAHRC